MKTEENKKQTKKFEEKIKELTTLNNNEKQKRAEEIKKLKSQISQLMNDAANIKIKDQTSDDEIKKKMEEAAIEASKLAEKELLKQSKILQEEISKLNKALDSSRKEMQEKVASFENEKESLKVQILSDNKSDGIIQGIKIFYYFTCHFI